MIKLVASDVDGTLVRDSSKEIYPEIFPVIKRLKTKGVITAIASGRQYHSIASMFAPVKNDLIFIAENGAHLRYGDRDIGIVKMNRNDAEDIVRYLREFDNTDIIVSYPGITRIESKNRDFIDLIRYGYNNNVEVVKDVLESDSDIIKIAVYRKGSIRDLGESRIIPKFEKLCHCFMAGEEWVDLVDFAVDKGRALKTVMDSFHIKKEETIAFGDNDNDLSMLETAGIGYAVSNAPEEIKNRADRICEGYEKRGVLKELLKIEESLI
ncbi:MAG: Cof-type HAD-IIB family hydrolase [Lachnospiraceae bacterium]|nr:Cof-type HAD-IIB family hydrolase [Lachnospiraceae bacterium]